MEEAKKVEPKTARLATIEKKYVCIEPEPVIDYQLTTKSVQSKIKGNSHKVMVYNILREKKKCMAFCFKWEGKDYFVAVSGNEIKLKASDTVKELNTCLFHLDEGPNEDWRSLTSVAQPDTFLCVENDKVTVKTKKDKVACFKIEYEEGSNTMRSVAEPDPIQFVSDNKVTLRSMAMAGSQIEVQPDEQRDMMLNICNSDKVQQKMTLYHSHIPVIPKGVQRSVRRSKRMKVKRRN